MVLRIKHYGEAREQTTDKIVRKMGKRSHLFWQRFTKRISERSAWPWGPEIFFDIDTSSILGFPGGLKVQPRDQNARFLTNEDTGEWQLRGGELTPKQAFYEIPRIRNRKCICGEA
jgi:hypothetical protein